MQILLLLGTIAAHAGKWDGAPSDVIVERVIPAEPAALTAPLSNLQVLAQLLPSDCVTDWANGTVTSGVGATSRVTYEMGPLRRRLTMNVTKVEEGRFVELDHPGKKGFVTQFRIEPADGGAKVTLGTYLSPPPRPFQGIYFSKVRPAWERCWTRALDNLYAMSTTSTVATP